MHTEAVSPTLDASTTVVAEVPRFDHDGGSRRLRSAEIRYSLLADLRLDVQANIFPEPSGVGHVGNRPPPPLRSTTLRVSAARRP